MPGNSIPLFLSVTANAPDYANAARDVAHGGSKLFQFEFLVAFRNPTIQWGVSTPSWTAGLFVLFTDAPASELSLGLAPGASERCFSFGVKLLLITP